jgi:glycosyltransferase involved in cell wall biosynthesis
MSERLAVCIPTRERPERLRALLESLLAQSRSPDAILVVDSSATEATADMCEAFPDVRHERSLPGLPLQRWNGVTALQASGPYDLICFLDDDVVLEPSFLEVLTTFLCTEGAAYAGAGGFDLERWGKPVFTLDRWWKRLRVLDGPLAPGRWFYCGHFLELDHIDRASGVHECDYLPGFAAMWRSEVFNEFRPPVDLAGYALGEDKHFGLRVHSGYRMAIVPDATLRHLHALGGRPRRLRLAFQRARANARFVRECDPDPSWLRYAACVLFHVANGSVEFVVRVMRGRVFEGAESLASVAGALSCVVPPALTADALVRRQGRRRG